MVSVWTMETRYLVETMSDPGCNFLDRCRQAAEKIFDFDYPFWSESERKDFESKFLLHFYTWEIGCVPFALWKIHLQNKLYEIMPMYVKMYEGIEKLNPLYDTFTVEKSTTEMQTKANGTTSTQSTSTTEMVGKDDQKTLDYPQANINSGDYLSGETVTDRTDNSSGETTGTATQTNNGEQTGKGSITKEGLTGARTAAEMVASYKKEIMSLYSMIFRDCEKLFIGVL